MKEILNANWVRPTVIQVMFVLVNLFISFFFTPYLLNQLGNEAYAFYPLSFNIINYATIVTVIFTSMLSKYITVDYHEQNFDRVNEFFNSSLYSNIIIGAVIGLPMLAGALFIDRILKVPVYLSFQVKLLFLFITLSFFVIQIRNTFMVANISTEKRYLTTFQRVVEKLLTVLLPILIFLVFPPSVAWLGASVFAATILRLFITVRTQKRIMPRMVVSRQYVKKSVVLSLMSGGLWHSFNQFTALLSTNVDILLANLLFGAAVQSEYSLAVVIPNLIRSSVIYTTNSFLPYLALLLKNDRHEELVSELPIFVKLMSVLMAIVVSLLIGFGDSFLALWIPDYYHPGIYVILILASLSILLYGAFSILYSILVIYDKVKIPALAMFLIGAANIPAAILIAKGLDLDVYGILISSLLMTGLQYLLFIPYYFSKKLVIPRKSLYPPFLRAMNLLIIGIGAGFLIKTFFPLTSFLRLILAVFAVLLLLLALTWFWIADQKDIRFLIDNFKTLLEYRNDLNELQSGHDDPLI